MKETNNKFLTEIGTYKILKLLVGLEIRKLMTVSVRELYNLVKTDQFCPNY